MNRGPPHPGILISTPIAKPLGSTDADLEWMNDAFSSSSSGQPQTRRLPSVDDQKYEEQREALEKQKRQLLKKKELARLERANRALEEDIEAEKEDDQKYQAQEEDEKKEQVRRRAVGGAKAAPFASEQNRASAVSLATAAASAIPALGPYAGAIGAGSAVLAGLYEQMANIKEENKRLHEENKEKLRGICGDLINKLVSANLIDMMKNFFKKTQISYNASLFYNTGNVSNLLLSLDEEEYQEVNSYYTTTRTAIMADYADLFTAYAARPPITGVWKHVETVKNFMEWQHFFIIGLSWLLYGVLCYQVNAWSNIKTAFEALLDDKEGSIRSNIYKWFATYFGDPANMFSSLFEAQGGVSTSWWARRWTSVKGLFSSSIGEILTHNVTVLFGLLAAGWASGFFKFIFDFFDTARELMSPFFMIKWIYTMLTCFHAGLIYNRNFTYKDIILKGFFEMPALKYSTKKYNFGKTKKSRKSPKADKKSPKAVRKSPKADKKSPKAIRKSPKAVRKSPKAVRKSRKASRKSPKAVKKNH